MTAEQWIGLGVLNVAAAMFAPSVVDRAIRNHRARKNRAALALVSAWLDSVQEWLDEEWDNEPTPMFDALVCEQLESQFDGGAA